MSYPSNSDKGKTGPPEEKKVERITSEEPIRRKKGIGSKFRSTFLGGDARSATEYVIFGVLIPAAKDAIAEAGAQGIERLVFGESRSRKRTSAPSGYGKIDYTSPSKGKGRPDISRRARSQHEFDEIVLTSRQEAENVVDRLFDLLDRYNSVSVADLYDLVGVRSTHTDHKWGWTDLRGATVARVRNGYLLDLPESETLD